MPWSGRLGSTPGPRRATTRGAAQGASTSKRASLWPRSLRRHPQGRRAVPALAGESRRDTGSGTSGDAARLQQAQAPGLQLGRVLAGPVERERPRRQRLAALQVRRRRPPDRVGQQRRAGQHRPGREHDPLHSLLGEKGEHGLGDEQVGRRAARAPRPASPRRAPSRRPGGPPRRAAARGAARPRRAGPRPPSSRPPGRPRAAGQPLGAGVQSRPQLDDGAAGVVVEELARPSGRTRRPAARWRCRRTGSSAVSTARRTRWRCRGERVGQHRAPRASRRAPARAAARASSAPAARAPLSPSTHCHPRCGGT